MNKFYITTTTPYVNAKPHIGFALEIVHADILARYHRLIGDDVYFNTGTDEHGQKIYKAALKEKKDPQKYVDEYAEKFVNPFSAAKRGYVDDIIPPSRTRFRVIKALTMLEHKQDSNPAKKHGNIPL